ncbi:hypothetical protein E2C01_035905 [Portunus trituberculatus]|uniref:Uncharacterized protein n=1 Tax=Portunus trituberculatus TaxID=210409 RepID=A0A5B7FAF0_PORTR|nr:hypothetical protein [Portunus trituberculatus]
MWSLGVEKMIFGLLREKNTSGTPEINYTMRHGFPYKKKHSLFDERSASSQINHLPPPLILLPLYRRSSARYDDDDDDDDDGDDDDDDDRYYHYFNVGFTMFTCAMLSDSKVYIHWQEEKNELQLS